MATPTATLPAFVKQTRQELHAKFVELEWQQRDRLLQGTQAAATPHHPSARWARLNSPAVMARNRYVNVEPFAQNRVKLRVTQGVNDYINASPIQLGSRRYIATQGPKDSSVSHFYRMIASELKSPAVVVMLTQTHEAGREKCFPYYPLSEEENPLVLRPDEHFRDGFRGEVRLLSVEEHAKTRSQVRRLRMTTAADSNPAEEKEIVHLLFSAWPDFLIPEGSDRAALVELVRYSAALNRPAYSDTTAKTKTARSSFAEDMASTDADNPRIIHCSAGVGRSGTFIALDYLISLLYSGQLDDLPPHKDPIADTVDQLRQQRMMMVQGESQFIFLYEVMRDQMLARMQNQDTTAGAQKRA